MDFADQLERARDRFQRGDCCPVGAVFFELGWTGRTWSAYPGTDQLRRIFGEVEGKRWWILVRVWDTRCFGAWIDSRAAGFDLVLARARELDAEVRGADA